MPAREVLEFDVVMVGGGPAGLAAACHLRQLCLRHGLELSVCVVEKGSEIGAHILSGAVIEPSALNELFPAWRELDAPLRTPVDGEALHLFTGPSASFQVPGFMIPKALRNTGNYVASLGDLCRWLARQAETLGVEILPGFAAAEILFDKTGKVCGIATGEKGRGRNGEEKPGYDPGYELRAAYTVFAEGCRGHLGKQLIARFRLDRDASPQHYAIGIKELWEIPPERHHPGSVLHGLGWPLGFGRTTGGSFLYQLENNLAAVGLVVDLNYRNPWLSPFDEFQRLKLHPRIKAVLEGGRRVAWGARALCKGGWQSLPHVVFPGGLLAGDDAGFLNFLKLKGSHSAMKSGMLAAESIVEAHLESPGDLPAQLHAYAVKCRRSWLGRELFSARNALPAFHHLGALWGAAYTLIDQAIFQGRAPFTLRDSRPDHATLLPAARSRKLLYPKPDNLLVFDKASSVYLANTSHAENQPCHLKLGDPAVSIGVNLPRFAEPAQRYCPAGVFEVVREQEADRRFQINPANCVHCKTCDIKDPARNITWTPPEGGSGPNYSNM